MPGVGASGNSTGTTRSGGIRRDRQSGLARAEHIDSLGRPEPEQQVDVVDDVIAVQMGEEDRARPCCRLSACVRGASRSPIARPGGALLRRSRRCTRRRRRRSRSSSPPESPWGWRHPPCPAGSGAPRHRSATARASGREPSMARRLSSRGEEHLRLDTCSSPAAMPPTARDRRGRRRP